VKRRKSWMIAKRILSLPLVFLIALSGLLLIADSEHWSSSRVSFDQFNILSVAVSQDGSFVAVAYGDNRYYQRFVDVYASNLSLVYRLQLNSFSDVSPIFLDNSTLVVTEFVKNAEVPYSYVHLVDIIRKIHLQSPRVPGTDLSGVRKAVVAGSTLYILTGKYLVGFTLDLSRRTYLKPFVNTGLQVLPLGDSVVVLSVETLCHICLMQNEKVITLITPRGENSYTISHALSLVRLPTGNLGIVYDNSTVEEITLSGAGIKPLRKLKLPLPLQGVSEPSYRLLYSLALNGLEVRLSVYSFADRALRELQIPLPYSKGDQIGLKVYDDGTYLAWDNYIVVLGNLSGITGIIDAGFTVRDAHYTNGKLYVVGDKNLAIFQRAPASSNYTLTFEVVPEQGGSIGNLTVIVNGATVGSFAGRFNLTLPSGFYNVTITAPGYVAVTVPVNLTSNARYTVVLQRVKYPLIVYASSTTGGQPEITVCRGNASLARGIGYLEVLLPEGNYTVVVSYGNFTQTRTISLRGRTEIRIMVNSTYTQQGLNAPGPNTPLEGNSSITAVVYGEETCPDCRQTRELLSRAVDRLVFKDISNQTFLAEYNYLYQLTLREFPRVVPLTLVFKGEQLLAVVVGPQDEASWTRILSLNPANATLVVTYQGEWVYRTINSTEVYRIALQGAPSPSPTPTTKTSELLPTILALAAADSINPCTFMVFAALVMAVMGISGRRKAVSASVAFISAVYVCYLLLGLGLIRFMSLFSWLKYFVAMVTVAAGAYAVVQSAFTWQEGCRDGHAGQKAYFSNIRRYFDLISQKLNSASHLFLTRAQKGSVAAAFLAGAAVSFTLLPCSSGPYIVATYMLAGESPAVALLLLMLYNLVFVLPLIAIAAGTIIGGRLLLMVDAVTVHLNALRRWTELALGLLLISLGIYIALFR